MSRILNAPVSKTVTEFGQLSLRRQHYDGQVLRIIPVEVAGEKPTWVFGNPDIGSEHSLDRSLDLAIGRRSNGLGRSRHHLRTKLMVPV